MNKFNIGDTVYFIGYFREEFSINKGVVTEISLAKRENTLIVYTVLIDKDDERIVYEQNLFLSIKEAINNLQIKFNILDDEVEEKK